MVAEVSAALGISRGRAAPLRDRAARAPAKLAQVFAAGVIDFRMMSTIVSRTDLIEDPDLLSSVDMAVERWCRKWMKLSQPKLIERIDWWVARFDPAGVRVPKSPTGNRYVDIGPTTPGMAGVWAHLPAPDALVLDDRLDAIAATVCADDPRTAMQRRADALAAMAAQQTPLACACESPDCLAEAGDKPWGELVIHLLADQATVTGQSETPG